MELISKGKFSNVYLEKNHCVKLFHKDEDSQKSGCKESLLLLSLSFFPFFQEIIRVNNYPMEIYLKRYTCNISHLIESKKPNLILYLDIINNISKGLHFMHQSSIIHCKLEKTNIYLDTNYRPYISNFTNACKLGDMNSIHPSIKKPPHFCRNEIVERMTIFDDIWSFGIVVFQMSFSKHPYNIINNLDVWNKQGFIPYDYKEYTFDKYFDEEKEVIFSLLIHLMNPSNNCFTSIDVSNKIELYKSINSSKKFEY